MTSNRICTHCGASNVSDAAICARCSSALGQPNVETVGEPPHARPEEVERLRVPVLSAFEEVERQQTSLRLVRRYQVIPADQLVITDARLLLIGSAGEVAFEVELDPDLFREAQQHVGEVSGITEIPFFGEVSVTRHLFKLRRSYSGSAGRAAIGCLGYILSYWFVVIAAGISAAVAGAAKSTIPGVLVFMAAVAVLRVRPKRMIVLTPRYARTSSRGLAGALERHLGSRIAWRIEVQVGRTDEESVITMLAPIAAALRHIAEGPTRYH